MLRELILFTIFQRYIYLTGKTRNGYQEYGAKYIYNNGPESLTLELYPQTRISWDATRVADNLVYKYAGLRSDYMGIMDEMEMTVGFSKLYGL